MRAELLREKIEAQFEHVEHCDTGPFGPTGERFIELHGGAEYGERAAWEAFLEYAKSRKGTLYWRITPEVDSDHGSGSYVERFYMRVLISEMPKLK